MSLEPLIALELLDGFCYLLLLALAIRLLQYVDLLSPAHLLYGVDGHAGYCVAAGVLQNDNPLLARLGRDSLLAARRR